MAPSSPQLARHPTYSLPASATQRQDRAGIIQVPYTNNNKANCCQIGLSCAFLHSNCELYITLHLHSRLISVLSTESTIRSTSPSTSGSTARSTPGSTCGSTGDSTRYSYIDSTIKSTQQGQIGLRSVTLFHSNSSDRTETNTSIQNPGLAQKYRSESQKIHITPFDKAVT